MQRRLPQPSSPARVSGWAAALLALVLVTLPACRAWPDAAAAAPAVISHPTAASRADLRLAVSRALGGAPARLADDALTHDSLMVVGRAPAHDVSGLPLNGRELGRPQHFRLLRRGSQCVLLHVETGDLLVLEHTTCHVLLPGHTQ